MQINVNSSNLNFFNALASNTRLKIIKHLLPNHKNIKDLANELNLSSTIVAKHVEILEQAGILKCEIVKAQRGVQKICRVVLTDYHLVFEKISSNDSMIQEFELPIGNYFHHKVSPTCGLATENKLIGICDDNRYFSHPEHVNAGILWFAHGEISYNIPSFLFENPENISELEISFEICSEAPGINEDFLSDIYFSLNSSNLGCWVSTGDFGKSKGKFTPKWWYLTEYGDLVTIKIDHNGTAINNELVNSTTLNDLALSSQQDSIFKISSPLDTKNPGGVNLFGKHFGNYDQGIKIKIIRN